MGQAAKSVRLYEVADRLDIEQGYGAELSIGLTNEGEALVALGELCAAYQRYVLALDLAVAEQDLGSQYIANRRLLGLFAIIGDAGKAKALLHQLRKLDAEQCATDPVVALRQAQLRFNAGKDCTREIGHAYQLAVDAILPRAIREARLLWGENELRQRRPVAAEAQWSAALLIAQRLNLPLAHDQANLARALAASGKHDEAKSLIAQIGADDQQGQALALAETLLMLGDHDAAKHYIQPGYRQAWADGAPYVFYDELRRAQTVLRALKMKEADLHLPPFDPTKVRQNPYEREIRVFVKELLT